MGLFSFLSGKKYSSLVGLYQQKWEIMAKISCFEVLDVNGKCVDELAYVGIEAAEAAVKQYTEQGIQCSAREFFGINESGE